LHKEPGPADRLQTREFRGVVAGVVKLVEGLQTGKNLTGQDYFSDPQLLGAYLLYQWVIHYQEGLSLFNELPITPKRVLDLCSGPAPFAFAALRHGCHDLIAADRSIAALNLGADLCGRYGMPITIRQWDCHKSPIPVEGQFDLIILGHCLDELFPSTLKNWNVLQRQFVLELLQRLTPEGFLLIVGNSQIDMNQRILQLRDQLVKENVPVQAPCVWKGDCPALQVRNSPCYAQRDLIKPYLIKEIQRAANINLSSLKMSYILFKSPRSNWPHLPVDRSFYRVISPPVESYQGKLYYLCGEGGKKTIQSRTETQSKNARAFDFLRRGELISIGNALTSPKGFTIQEDTEIRIEAACSKPIPER
jgi:ribosomal protein RSM22 (predicted rRNA methylase)